LFKSFNIIATHYNLLQKFDDIYFKFDIFYFIFPSKEFFVDVVAPLSWQTWPQKEKIK
jgi:hypothetical protein